MENKDHPDETSPACYEGCYTLWEIYQRTVKRFPDRQFLGTRNLAKEGAPYEWKNHRYIYDTMDLFSRGKIMKFQIF